MWRAIQVGWFLAYRQIKRSSIWTTGLIVFIMTLTFLNLVVTSGILVGLIVGINQEFKTRLNGDLTISPLDEKKQIEKTTEILSLIRSNPDVVVFSTRYIKGATLEAGYKTRKDADEPNKVSAPLVGIDPTQEDEFGGLSGKMIEGRFLEPGDSDVVVLGKDLVQKYQVDVNRPSLKKVETGDKIRIKIGDNTKEYTIVGIIKAKADAISGRAYMAQSEFLNFTGAVNYDADEIAIKTTTDAAALALQKTLKENGYGQFAKIQTFEEGTPQFVRDIAALFGTLGNFFGSIGIVVASITLFIVVFINAVTRRKYIGILKGIGVSERAIEYAYVMQSFFYSVIGSGIGILITYTLLVPFFQANPINFPFSDGILVAPLDGTLIRMGILVFTAIVAGYIPAKMIVRQNTLNAILGR